MNGPRPDIPKQPDTILRGYVWDPATTTYPVKSYNNPTSEVWGGSKWENREGRGVNAKAEVTMQKGVISIKEPICNHSEELKRSLVEKFNADATLIEVRKWSYNT
ncbi:hypothetical protein H5410_004685 [Solanum commersonii]|uniref:Uncharacterized protein n=1 Tax=Solanum commersonii TaxID=4109 RepID=A0A9J6B8C5_SOLCO|nr:hypothetical protein H5410_004685 [Solanum commersonii]